MKKISVYYMETKISTYFLQAEAEGSKRDRAKFFASMMGRGILLLSISLIKYRLLLLNLNEP